MWDETRGYFVYSDHNADLNLLIAPMYAWLYKQTGNALYRERGDSIFKFGARQAWLGSGKQFNQNYRSTFNYVLGRSQNA
jgi:hypothetical protein